MNPNALNNSVELNKEYFNPSKEKGIDSISKENILQKQIPHQRMIRKRVFFGLLIGYK